MSAEAWNAPDYDKLWLYNLHYFDDLNAVDADLRLDWHRALIARWIAENPPTFGNGWEPYPLSLRIVNWIKWDLRVGGLDQAAVDSLALQLRWLRRRLEYHILGNHLLANAKALIYGGLYFQGREAQEWLRTGVRIFDQQLIEQVLPDGGHFELSPMYHLIVLEDLLDVVNIMRVYDQAVPDRWLDTVRRMLHWADVMCHPDGQIPFFNDAAFGVAGTIDELRRYADRLGVYTDEFRSGSVFLQDSGYVRLENADAVVFVDVAPVGPDYLPGHGHADALSVEMSLFGHRVLVNSGTSLYGAGPERLRQRGTGAHNTIMVDGLNSSEVWGGFRVARRARVHVMDVNLVERKVLAEHDGYQRLPGRVAHRRQVSLGRYQLEIVDTIETVDPGTHHIFDVQGAWHFHPSVSVEEMGSAGGDAGYRLCLPGGNRTGEVYLTIRGAEKSYLEPCTWHPEFGQSLPNTRLVFRRRSYLPVTFTTVLQWRT